MTAQERQAAYLKALEALAREHGFTIGAQIVPRQVGPQLQVEAQVVLVPVEGWTEPVVNLPTADAKNGAQA